MANEDERCRTCGGDQVLIGDSPDRRGERTDDEQFCECVEVDLDDRDLDEERDLHAIRFGGDS